MGASASELVTRFRGRWLSRVRRAPQVFFRNSRAKIETRSGQSGGIWENGGRCVARLHHCQTAVPQKKSLPDNSEPLTPLTPLSVAPLPHMEKGVFEAALSAVPHGWQSGPTDKYMVPF